MKRAAGVLLLVAGLGGCISSEMQVGGCPGGGQYMSQVWNNPSNGCFEGAHVGAYTARPAPGVIGPMGAPVPQMASAGGRPEYTGADMAREVIAKTMSPDLIRASYDATGGSGLMQAQYVTPPGAGGPGAGPVGPPPGACGPGGCPPNGAAPLGMMPMGNPMMTGLTPPGAVAAVGANLPGAPSPFPVQRTEVRFTGPNGMKISWYAPKTDCKGVGFSTEFLTAPGRYNFPQAAIYRLKLSDLPNRPGVDLYPTLEVVPANNKTCTFLAHSAVPVTFTEEDLEQVAAGNYVVKVIYLPDPQYQDLAGAAEEVVSSRLEPGVDPIAEACRRGSILLVIRLGNIDLEAANTPPMDAPAPWCQAPPPAMPQGPPMGMAGMPGMGMPGMPGMPGMLPGAPPMPGMQGVLPNLPGMPAPKLPTPPAQVPATSPVPTSQVPSASGVTPATGPMSMVTGK
jgi:hypothetical protein